MSRPCIKVDPNAANRQLVMVSTGRGSAFQADIVGIPSSVTNVQFHLQEYKSEEYKTFDAEPLANYRWLASIPGSAFLTVGDMKYHVTAMDDDGRSVWFGVGKMRVLPGVSNVFVPQDDPVPSVNGDVYIRNRKTGLWHKVEMDVDDDGIPYPVYSAEGIERIPEERPSPSGDGNVYVRNRKTGLWHKVEMENDENGTPYPVYSREGIQK